MILGFCLSVLVVQILGQCLLTKTDSAVGSRLEILNTSPMCALCFEWVCRKKAFRFCDAWTFEISVCHCLSSTLRVKMLWHIEVTGLNSRSSLGSAFITYSRADRRGAERENGFVRMTNCAGHPLGLSRPLMEMNPFFSYLRDSFSLKEVDFTALSGSTSLHSHCIVEVSPRGLPCVVFMCSLFDSCELLWLYITVNARPLVHYQKLTDDTSDGSGFRIVRVISANTPFERHYSNFIMVIHKRNIYSINFLYLYLVLGLKYFFAIKGLFAAWCDALSRQPLQSPQQTSL